MSQESIEGFRLSPQQHYLWSLQRTEDTNAYHACCAISIEGSLDRSLLKAALDQVIERHEILRTAFHVVPKLATALQIINESGTVVWAEHDLSSLEREAQTTVIGTIFSKLRYQRIDLEYGPLVHAVSTTLSPQRHMLFIGLPALCADTEALAVLMREISKTYAALARNTEVLGEPAQYVDLAEWQNELLESAETEAGRAFWRKQELSPLSKLSLPSETPAPSNQPFTPICLAVTVHAEMLHRLEMQAQTNDTSVAALLLACWQSLIACLTGQSDPVIGVTFDGRKHDEVADALGLFARHIPIHAHVSGQESFDEVARQLHKSLRKAHSWQEYFTWDDIPQSDPAIDAPRFFPVCFEFQEWPAASAGAGNIFTLERHSVCIDRFSIKLSCTRRDDTLLIDMHYDSSVFRAEAIDQLTEEFQVLLQSVLDNPSWPIARLNMLGVGERQRLLETFNNTRTTFLSPACIHQIFEEQAARIPNQPAVVFADRCLTYAELNQQANRLARRLQSLGVGPEVVVGLSVERSLDMLVALLGILKAGGAYLPLDPDDPQERCMFMLQEMNCPAVVTQTHLRERFASFAGTVVEINAPTNHVEQQSDTNLDRPICGSNLAYSLYTSGSTGQPKGTMIEHCSLTNYLEWVDRSLLSASVQWLPLITKLSFDASLKQLFVPLMRGHAVWVLTSDLMTQPDRLLDIIANRRDVALNCVPSLWKALLSELEWSQRALPQESLTHLLVGGEQMPRELVERTLRLLPHLRIHNLYGPTEYTANACAARVDSSDAITIGRPIANTRLYVLDSHARLVPIGVAGELYVGGVGVARGYRNRPGLTAERFVPDPFSHTPGGRLYRTGDLVRWLADGRLEFLGRIDYQVKIRGFRVELGEIEAALLEHPNVCEVVVLAREDQLGQKQLVAYVVQDKDTHRVPGTTDRHSTTDDPLFSVLGSSQELRQFLSERLPEYMVPSTFVTLEVLPLLPNGKVDRRALPAPETVASTKGSTYVAPQTEAEQILAKIWAEVLRRDRVGIHNNFFAMGGDSILSIQIIARANQAGLRLTPKQLFQHQTIAALAAVAGTTPPIVAEQGLVTGPVPLTPIQRWFFDRDLPERHHFNQSVLLEVRRRLDFQQLPQTIRFLLQHHDALRLRFMPDADSWQQINGEETAVERIVTYVDLAALPQAEQAAALEAKAAELQASLDLTNGPLIRVALFDLGPDQPQRLLVIIHHLAVDGVSWRVILEDLQNAYQQLERDGTLTLPPKTTSFKQWSERLVAYAQSSELSTELPYWTTLGQYYVAEVPRDHPDGSNTIASIDRVVVSLSLDETNALLHDVPPVYQTQINDLLLTALAQTFAAWTGTQALLLDLEGHGREDLFGDVDLGRTVGWFTSIFPVVLDLDYQDEPGAAIKAIKEQLRQIPNRGIGYGVLRYFSQDQRIGEQLAALPVPEISFNYLGQTDQIVNAQSIFGPARESSGPMESARGARGHVLEITGMISGDRLHLAWIFSSTLHRRATIEAVAERYLQALTALIIHCQSPDAGGFTPSDLPEAELSQEEMDVFFARIAHSQED